MLPNIELQTQAPQVRVVQTRFMADFSDKNCFFTRRGGWTVANSSKPELLEFLDRGDAFLSRLDGERCLCLGD